MALCSKHPDESINVGVDFAARIPGGVTISTPTVSVVTGDVTLGSPSVSGSIISIRVSGGTALVTSSLEFKAALSDGETLAGIIDIPVNARVF